MRNVSTSRAFAGLVAWTLALGTQGVATGQVCESTGFEPQEATCGWETGSVCGSEFVGLCEASGTPPVCTGNNSTDGNCCIGNRNPLNGWFMSISSQHCNEPHIDTVNPASGTQHLRFSRDVTGGNPPGCTGLGGACRQSARTPPTIGPLPIRPTTISFDIALSADLSEPVLPQETALSILILPNSAHFIGAILNFNSSGGVSLDVFDNDPGILELGILTGDGSYDNITIDVNPCVYEQTFTLTNSAGEVTGKVVANLFKEIFEVTQVLIFGDNSELDWDIDNFSIVRGDSLTCGCGDDAVQGFLGEECEGTEDDVCPGRCRPPGDTEGDGECTCVRDCRFCDDDQSCVAGNGTNGPFLTHGGFFTYVPDGPFTMIDTCGSDFNSALFVGAADFCATLSAVVNGLCADLHDPDNPENTPDPCSDGNNATENCAPFASCFNNATSGESCICLDTVAGEPISIWAAGFPGVDPPLGSTLFLTITKALSCGPAGEAIPNGACCNRLDGTCADNVRDQDCAAPFDTFYNNKLCEMVNCDRVAGGCCDSSPGLGGQCSADVFAEDCLGNLQDFSKLDDTCGGSCEEVTGACCDGFTGNCFVSIQSGCPNGSHFVWNLGAACNQNMCEQSLGACCDAGTNDPTVATCTTTTLAACDCVKCTWTRDADCQDIVCDANFLVIPAVSEWGLAILALTLLIVAKVRSHRKCLEIGR